LCGLILLHAICAGCGGSEELARVDGVVRLDGKPLGKGIVTFVPAAGRSASGSLGNDGTFRLGTYGKTDGALVGTHHVTITATETPTGPPNFDVDRPAVRSKDLLVPARYASTSGSGLTFDVKAGERNQAEFDLTSK
jgi:hypothetical protein